MARHSRQRDRLAAYLGFLLALSLPFWLLGVGVQLEPLPGLPLSGLMAFAPALVASGLVLHDHGPEGLWAFLARPFDLARMAGRWRWAPVILLAPTVAFAAFAAGHWGRPWPAAAVSPWVPLAMFAAFFFAALGEELGWTAYALEPLARRRGELGAALILGLIWAAWHVIPFLQADRSWDWIAWQCLKTVAVRVVMVQLYFGSGRSLCAVALFHALDNVSAFLPATWGVTYDARFTAVAMVVIAAGMTAARRRVVQA